jgi:hypothetical protein
MTRRFCALIIEFEDDEALLRFAQTVSPEELLQPAREALRECLGVDSPEESYAMHLHRTVYDVVPHQSAPYIYPATVRGLTLREPDRWCDGVRKVE